MHNRSSLDSLSYACGFPEKAAYATSNKSTGPWTFRSLLGELAGNCNTAHEVIIEFKGRSCFIDHIGGTPTGGSFRRSVCVDELHESPDGTIQRVIQTSEGVTAVLP